MVEDNNVPPSGNTPRACGTWAFLTPSRCRYDPDNPPAFTWSLNFLFAFAACFTVANIYYCHPILDILAREFNVSDEQASMVAALAQAGYCGGIYFLVPLGDLFPRRRFTLLLIAVTAVLWIGLCVTTSFHAFMVLTFITSFTTITPQIMLPLSGNLAPAHRRATMISVTVSGLLLGLLVARVLSGIVAHRTSWRNVYWLSLGLQCLIFVLLFLFMPDYPSVNPDKGLKNYPRVLADVFLLPTKIPTLAQACLNGLFTSTIFTNYWTTLTFLLAGPHYRYSTLVIGCFAFIGMLAIAFGPPYSRLVIDKLVPLISMISSNMIMMVGVLIGTFTSEHTVAGPIVEGFLMDFGQQMSQVANRSAVYTLMPEAQNRINSSYTVSIFFGQLIGTTVGNHLYAQGGWVRSGYSNIAFITAALAVAVARGPWETGWVGWGGGWGARRRDLNAPKETPEA